MAKEYRVSLGGDKNVLKLIVVKDVLHPSVRILKSIEIYTLND